MMALLSVVQWQLPSPGYAAMTSAVKQHYHLPDRGLDKPMKVIISLRPANFPLSSRILSNAQQIADALRQRGFNTEVGNRMTCFRVASSHCTAEAQLMLSRP